MKFNKVILVSVLTLGLLGLITGCKKKSGSGGESLAPMVIEGVNVDLPKLRASIDASGNADLQGGVRNVLMAFRYHQYEKALMEIDKLSNDPALNDEQKKLVTEVLEQVKQVAEKAPPPAQ